MTMSKELGKLEEEALKRKERLKNLKRKFEGHKDDSNGNGENDKSAIEEVPKSVFSEFNKRNYPNEFLPQTNVPKLQER